ncbi:hypothetical protein QBZ16_003976 [Prototheca wickerhamii]|uniref:Uncharacterized protein n=1 Tax=Prototheca wickerhamii TaxID=3111 RepID=A0AAD9MLG6_PROWI|nr:hypothetical protein QBZ16_003976 [Prototheca wickerhamii]
MKVNSESLQALNAYADQLAAQQSPRPAELQFYVRAPTANSTLEPALTLEHAALASAIAELRARLERAFELAHVQLSNEYPLQALEQRMSVAALRALASILEADPDPARFRGVAFCVAATHAPGRRERDHAALPLPACRLSEEGTVLLSVPLRGDEVEPATLATLRAALAAVDAARAAAGARGRLLAAPRLGPGAGAGGPARGQIERRLGKPGPRDAPRRGFGLLVAGAADEAAHDRAGPVPLPASPPLLEPVPGSAYVQVRADCPWPVLVEFLASHGATDADRTARLAEAAREREAEALEAARSALGVRSLLRLCATEEEAAAAARRLKREAPALRRALPQLESLTLALDDGYRIWDTGLVSIPHDFAGGAELVPELLALLGPSTDAASGAPPPAACAAGQALAAGPTPRNSLAAAALRPGRAARAPRRDWSEARRAVTVGRVPHVGAAFARSALARAL